MSTGLLHAVQRQDLWMGRSAGAPSVRQRLYVDCCRTARLFRSLSFVDSGPGFRYS